MNHDVNSHSNSRKDEIRVYAGNSQNSREVDSSSEIIRLSGELNQRITQERNDLMSSVSSQIERAISEAINEQDLPQIKTTLRSDKDKYLVEDEKSRAEDRNIYWKKSFTASSDVAREMIILEASIETKTQ